MSERDYLDRLEVRRGRQAEAGLERHGPDSARRRCVVCSKVITRQFTICRNCEGVFGESKAGWPEWLKFLAADERRQVRLEESEARRGLSEYPTDEEGEPLEDLEPIEWEEDLHGTQSGYVSGCRCGACTKAHRNAARKT